MKQIVAFSSHTELLRNFVGINCTKIMNLEEFRLHCLSVKGATESFPFDDVHLAFKVMGKMFALTSLEPTERGFRANLKCDPELAEELRTRYTGVESGWHMNKKHWNSVYLNSDVPDSEIQAMIVHSAKQVLQKLPRRLQVEYDEL